MAKIPTYTQQGQYQAGRRAGPRDFGGGEGLAAIGQAVGQVGELSLKFLDLQQTTMVNDAVANAQVELSQLESMELENPDFIGRAGRYGEEAARIKKDLSSGLLPRYRAEYEDRFDPTAARGEARVRKSAWTGQIDAAKASLDVYHRTMSIDAVKAESDTERDLVFGNFNAMLTQRVAQGLIGEAEGVRRSFAFADSVMSGSVRDLIRTNPKRAIDELGDPEGPYAGASPEKQGIWMDRAVSAWDAQLRKEGNEERKQYRANEQKRKITGRIASASIITDIEAGNLDAAQTTLEANINNLESGEYQTFLRAITAGGFANPVETNPFVYSELSRMATRDVEDLRTWSWHHSPDLGKEEIVQDLINKAFLSRQLTLETRDKLVKASKTHRFDTVGGILHDGIEAIQTRYSVGRGTSPKKLREGQNVILDWEDWKSENPRASRSEARDKVKDLLEKYDPFSVDNPKPKADPAEVKAASNELIANKDKMSSEEFNRRALDLLEKYGEK
jgi:hypothetical protein